MKKCSFSLVHVHYFCSTQSTVIQFSPFFKVYLYSFRDIMMYEVEYQLEGIKFDLLNLKRNPGQNMQQLLLRTAMSSAKLETSNWKLLHHHLMTGRRTGSFINLLMIQYLILIKGKICFCIIIFYRSWTLRWKVWLQILLKSHAGLV